VDYERGGEPKGEFPLSPRTQISSDFKQKQSVCRVETGDLRLEFSTEDVTVTDRWYKELSKIVDRIKGIPIKVRSTPQQKLSSDSSTPTNSQDKQGNERTTNIFKKQNSS